jgi:hypothetical protein
MWLFKEETWFNPYIQCTMQIGVQQIGFLNTTVDAGVYVGRQGSADVELLHNSSCRTALSAQKALGQLKHGGWSS